MVLPKRPSGQHSIMDEYRRRLYAVEELANSLKRRIDVIDGNGNDLAEGGFIGRMKKEHDQNQLMLKSILGLLISALIGIIATYIKK